MNETNNPLNDFLNSEEMASDNNLFADMPFPTFEESVQQPDQPHIAEQLTDELPTPKEVQQPTLFSEALAKTPAAITEDISSESDDPFTMALKKARADSEGRISESFAEKNAIFSYAKAKDPIADRDCTFEDLRIKYETDFPELSESKKVTWSITYGKVTKSISNPGSDKVYDIKSEIEKSKSFLDNLKKAKNDADKNPECLVKPRVIAQSKGEIQPPAYKDYCASINDAYASDKPIVIIPSQDGKIYEMRKTPVGTFTAPAEHLPEFPIVGIGFQLSLPKIPMHILMFILNFFEKLSDEHELEALVHILYDTIRRKYTIRVPKQKLTHTSVHSLLEEEYPEHLIHVMDIHSHNIMPAKFSQIDDNDEKATRLYAVVGKLNQVFPDITVRASCGGKFIPLRPEDVFDTKINAYPYPSMWDEQIAVQKSKVTPKSLSEMKNIRYFRRLANEIQ